MKKQEQEPARIVGQGTLSGASGLPFVLVTSSSEPGRVHVVAYSYEGAYVGARMHCDCVAASYGKHCRHAQLVSEWLAAGLAALGLPYTHEQPEQQSQPETPEYGGFGAKSAPRQSLTNRTAAFSLMK